MTPTLILAIQREVANLYSVLECGKDIFHGAYTLKEEKNYKNSHWKDLERAVKKDTRRNSVPGGGYGNTAGGPATGSYSSRSSFTDTEQAEEEQAVRLFVKEIFEDLVQRFVVSPDENLILVCGPKVLGIARSQMPKLIAHERTVTEIQKNPASFKQHELQDMLAEKGLIPKRNMEREGRTPQGLQPGILKARKSSMPKEGRV